MPDSAPTWNPDFADRIEAIDEDEEIANTPTATPSGRKRTGSDHSGLCRRPPHSSPRR